MLVELAVRNLGVIEELRLGFGGGLTALTGETGAGKTMVVEAIALLLGAPPDPTRVRPGADELFVEGLFVDERTEAETVLCRLVPRVGRSRAYQDGRLVPAAKLQELGAALIEIHGQHAQQALLGRRAQRRALDRFAGIDLAPLRDLERQRGELASRLDALGGDPRARARELDLLDYQIRELQAANLEDPGEDARLEVLESELGGVEALRNDGLAALAQLVGEDAALDAIRRAGARLGDHPSTAELRNRLHGVIAELEDLGAELRSLVERVEDDPRRLEEVRARRRLLGELTRKYGDTLAEVIAYRDELDQRRAELIAYEERAAELGAAITEVERRRRQLARDVGDRRRRAAPTLAREIEAHLREVALPEACVEVVVDDDEDGDGNRVELLLSTNRGLEPQPLARVASGGELSRAMLALHLTLSTGPPTMVFDEVDAGLGGVAATSVGRSLARLAASRQVIVVTHLAQVAAFAQDQLVVEKSAEGSVTSACVRRLEPQERVVEISRMMSGSPQSTSAREHAEELLAAAASEWSR